MSKSNYDEPIPQKCLYCGVHDLLYRFYNDGPMCYECVEYAKKELKTDITEMVKIIKDAKKPNDQA